MVIISLMVDVPWCYCAEKLNQLRWHFHTIPTFKIVTLKVEAKIDGCQGTGLHRAAEGF